MLFKIIENLEYEIKSIKLKFLQTFINTKYIYFGIDLYDFIYDA